VINLEIPKNHPRYQSLKQRERLLEFYEKGVVTVSGLISHGRGEAFDYILGETSTEFAIIAEMAAFAKILESKNPVISVNGNVTALADEEIVAFSKKYNIKVEANIFYWSEDRINKIVDHFSNLGLNVLGRKQDERIPGLMHDRGRCEKDGIFSADTVLIPLEDGDRAEALKKMGKFIITIDLNPLSRTSIYGDISIVDDVRRAFHNFNNFSLKESKKALDNFNNHSNLENIKKYIGEKMNTMTVWPEI
jgi:4-phosphopantoate--beta-alanine ligase